MLLPITETNPAEVMVAVRAVHVVATLIFLDIGPTLGARFSVGQDPLSVLTFCTLFLDPELG